MNAAVEIGNKKYSVDFSQGHDISIPMLFNGEQPNSYGVPKAIGQPYNDGEFIGDVRKGGYCNFETYTLTPHCNGTHTECIGHITDERVDLLASLKDIMIPATLISVAPENSSERYEPKLNGEDLLITKAALQEQLCNTPKDFLQGLIIRTIPNENSKKERDYMQEQPAFFSIEAMEYLNTLGVQHLLVDMPSVDRLFDDGVLSSHHIFWETKGTEKNKHTANKTITEMIYADNKIPDGYYLMNLQIPAFVADAAPCRPILFDLNEV
ncbi:MAG TPA: cyclase family protein [Flavobacteriales bacterium]|nr:cyclase family protein [Flavobacteriales bacterium]